MGNHEYYGSKADEVERLFRAPCSVHGAVPLHKDSVTLFDTPFVGATMWTDTSKVAHLGRHMNDYHCTDLTIDRVSEMHRDQVAWLSRQELGRSVVVTHHVP